MPFRFLLIGHSDDPDNAVEQISDIVPLENARVDGDTFVVETQEMDGWRNKDTANMNQLEFNGDVQDWNRYTDLQPGRIMQYGKRS